jgi:hypothetical protein
VLVSLNPTRSGASLFCGNEKNREVSESPSRSNSDRIAEGREESRNVNATETADAKAATTATTAATAAAANRSSRCSSSSNQKQKRQ